MKRVMFVVVSLLLVGTCFAQLQSGPSNTVGYVKIDIASGTQASPTYKEFGLPFQFWDVPTNNVPTYGVESRKPSDIVGTQSNCGTLAAADRILRQDTGAPAYRLATSCSWSGTLETGAVNMDPGRAYWYINKSAVARTLVLAGQVNNGNYGVVAIPAPAINGQTQNTAYSWRDARDVPNNQLNLLANGFTGGTISTSDRVQAQTGGAFFWFRTSDNTWQGTLTVVSPGKSYWILNKHAGHSWNYNYLANGTPISNPGDNGTRDIQIVPNTGKQAATSRTATN